MRSFLALFGAFVVACGSGGSESTDEADLQTGTPTTKVPEVGYITLRDGGFCSGTLIAPDVVLTAAHCVDTPVDAFYTGPGEPIPAAEMDRNPTNVVRHEVDDAIGHPSWAGPYACPSTGDIGLVHLRAPITDITPATFKYRRDLVSWSTCLGLGYGTHDGLDGVTVKQKRMGHMKVTEFSGDAVRAKNGNAPPRTGPDGRGLPPVFGEGTNAYTDRGDSGGPLRCDTKILAVTSCGPSGSVDGWYTLVEPYEPWIRENIERWQR
jgi:secreted trypsin-like serine protease